MNSFLEKKLAISFPDEIWKTIVQEIIEKTIFVYQSPTNMESEMRNFSRVSKSWSRIINDVIRTSFRFFLNNQRKFNLSNWLLSQFSDIENLDLFWCKNLNDETLLRFTNLKELNAQYSYLAKITPLSLGTLTNLTKLAIVDHKITNKSLSFLTNLKILSLASNSSSRGELLDEGLRSLTKLETLELIDCSIISDKGLEYLINLQTLKTFHSPEMSTPSGISDQGLQKLTSLTELSFYHNQFSHQGISNLINLRSLQLDTCRSVSFSKLGPILTNLTRLVCWAECDCLSDSHLRQMTSLKSLDLYLNRSISNDGIMDLTNLSELDLAFLEKIDNDGIQNLTLLTHLRVNRNITLDGLHNLKLLTSLVSSANLARRESFAKRLTQLKSLSLYEDAVTDAMIKQFTNLTFLHIDSDVISDDGISNLVNLTSLNLSGFNNVSDQGIRNLTNLTTLLNSKDSQITKNGLASLPALISYPDNSYSFSIEDNIRDEYEKYL